MNTSPEYFRNCVHVSSSRESILTEDAPSPRQYFRFAQDDLAEADSARTRINALANCKRALHLQLSTILDGFGFRTAKVSFPGQVAVAERCGLIAPRLLRKLNRLRNLSEHEYYEPNREEVEDAVDVTELFLGATDWLIMHFPSTLDIASGDEDTEPVSRIAANLELAPRSGVLVATVSEYLGPAQPLHEMANAIQSEWVTQMGAENDTVVSPIFKEHSYREAKRRMGDNRQFTVKITEGTLFEKWLTYIVLNSGA